MINKEQKRFSISSRKKSFSFAYKGLKLFFKTQHNSWIHLAAAFLVIGSGLFFSLNAVEWCLISLAIGLVLVAEILNTSIEFLTDLVSPDYNEKAGQVKDIAAGAVLVATVISIAIALFIFLPKVCCIFCHT